MCLAIAQPQQHLTQADVDKLMTELSNWGRWGKTDELGTVNLITPEKRRAALRLANEGVSVSLSRNSDSRKAVDNGQPFGHKMMIGVGEHFNMDECTVAFHGFANTHFDSLSHVYYRGRMYNGFLQSSVTATGAGHLAVTAFRDGIITRGVLIDIPRLKGAHILSHPRLSSRGSSRVGEEDWGSRLVRRRRFIRTGRWARRLEKGPWDASQHSAGLYASSAQWFKQRDVALLGSDGSHDVISSGISGVAGRFIKFCWSPSACRCSTTAISRI